MGFLPPGSKRWTNHCRRSSGPMAPGKASSRQPAAGQWEAVAGDSGRARAVEDSCSTETSPRCSPWTTGSGSVVAGIWKTAGRVSQGDEMATRLGCTTATCADAARRQIGRRETRASGARGNEASSNHTGQRRQSILVTRDEEWGESAMRVMGGRGRARRKRWPGTGDW